MERVFAIFELPRSSSTPLIGGAFFCLRITKALKEIPHIPDGVPLHLCQ